MSRHTELLSEMHKATAKHERSLAEHCRKTAGDLMTLHKESGLKPEDESTESTLAAHFHKEADIRDKHADRCDAAMAECDKASREDDLHKLVPDGIRGVIPIPRAGQRPFSKVAIDPEFEHIVGPDPEAEL